MAFKSESKNRAFVFFMLSFDVKYATQEKKSKITKWGKIVMEVPFIKYTANHLCRAA